jgi:hypothetical protein
MAATDGHGEGITGTQATEGTPVAVEVWQAVRTKGRSSLWAFRVTVADAVVFESVWVAVRYSSASDAEWLAGLIDRLATQGAFAGCPGHPGQTEPVLWWGVLGSDHGATVGDIVCHAEHMFGPVRGGNWYCQVSRGDERLFHTADSSIQPRSGNAAWWMCEVVVCAARAGVWVPNTASHHGAV